MIIGLTGGIGSGKSKVAKYLAEYGYTVVDADAIQREVTANNSPIIDVLSDAFHVDLKKEDGSLNRALLGKLAFANEENTALLNSIVTNKIIEIAKERLIGDCVFDAPTLYENNLEYLCDLVVVVTSDRDIRIARVQKRDGLSRHDILNRMARQMPEEEKIEKADYVIYNNQGLEELRNSVKVLIRLIK